MQDARKTLADNIKEFRAFQKINQFEFAEDCGLCRETLSLIERGRVNTTLDTIDLIACRMGVPPASLLTPRYILEKGVRVIDTLAYTVYGIGVVEDGVLVDLVPDVSVDRQFVEMIVDACNAYRLSPIHLRDVIMDFLP